MAGTSAQPDVYITESPKDHDAGLYLFAQRSWMHIKGHYYETILRNFVVENTTERPYTSNLLRDNKFKVRRKHLSTWLHKKQIWCDT